jgi:hypothetical protein
MSHFSKNAWNVALLLLAFTQSMAALAKDFKINSSDGIKPIYSASRALLIGVDKYEKWDRLSTIPGELGDLKAALMRQGFESADINVVLDPTADRLKREIEDFFKAPADRQTRLFLFFAGHGFTDNKSTGYIVAADAPPKGDPNLKRYAMGMDIISLHSEESNAKHVLMVFDSCFSGAIFLTRGAANLPSPLFIADAERNVRQFITSGSEIDEVPAQSEFISQFILGMDGAADTVIDGIVTGNELGYWLKATITPKGKQTPQYGSSTTRDFRRGDFMFASLKARQLDSTAAGSKKIPLFANAQATRGGDHEQATSTPHGYADTQIYYYAKSADGDRVEKALDAESIPYFKTRAIKLPERFEVNAIACGPDVPIDLVKNVALALTRGNVPVRAIIPFQQPAAKQRRVEILSLSRNAAGETSLATPALTEAQIKAIKNCNWLQNGGRQR